MSFVPNTFSLSCSWTIDKVPDATSAGQSVTSEAFEFEGRKVFRAQLTVRSVHPLVRDVCEGNNQVNHEYTFTFLSVNHYAISCKISDVTYSVSTSSDTRFGPVKMTKKTSADDDVMQVFTVTSIGMPYTSPLIITFDVQLNGIVRNYFHQLLDSTWTTHLWSAALNKQLTDVEFIVDGELFSAHRVIVSARSPVLFAMFHTDMIESKTGRADINGVDPVTFQHFLKFLYTGTVDSVAMSDKLLQVADRYQVETLLDLCKSVNRKIDIEHLTTTIMS